MNRTQRQHGARAGWHAAKIAAHQYTQTKRKPLAPIGDAYLSDVMDTICSDCGYTVCSCALCPKCGPRYYCVCKLTPAAPAKALDVPAVNADAWAPEACGWRPDGVVMGPGPSLRHTAGAFVDESGHVKPSEKIYWRAADDVVAGYAPTLAQAMCCALGIEIVRCVDGVSFFAIHGTALLVDGNYDLDAESCARAALHAFHAGGGRS